MYCVLCIASCVLCIVYCVLCISVMCIVCVVCIVYCVICIVCVLCNVYCVLCYVSLYKMSVHNFCVHIRQGCQVTWKTWKSLDNGKNAKFDLEKP